MRRLAVKPSVQNTTKQSFSFITMKSIVLLAAAIAVSVPARAAEAGGYKSESKAMSEIFASTITKVYAAQDGDYRYVAYAVVWRGQEVIVTPYSTRHDDLAVGDTVRCEMRQSHLAAVGGTKGRMVFTLIGRPGEPTPLGFGPASADDAARLEAVSAEVARRRAEREALSGKVEAKAQGANAAPAPAPSSDTRRP